MSRVSRQVLLWGQENQKKLRDSTICVTGGSILSQYTAAGLAALGIGNIILINNKKISMCSDGEFLIEKNDIGKPKVYSMTRKLKKISPETKIIPLDFPFCGEILDRMSIDLIVDCDVSGHEGKAMKEYSFRRKIPLIRTTKSDTEISVHKESLLRRTSYVSNQCIRPHEAAIAAGFTCDIIRKEYIKLPDDNITKRYFTKFTSIGSSIEYDNKRVLIIGAGALGNFTALCLAQIGAKYIDIIDFDTVDLTNLNRQIMLYDAIGKYKSQVLANRIRQVSRGIHANGIVGRLTKQTRIKDYDIVLGCVDKIKARMDASDLCRKNRIPYIDGATSSLSGDIYTYLPGHSPCIKCQRNLESLLRFEAERTQSGCQAASPSVITPNMIIGSAIANRTTEIFMGVGESQPLRYGSACLSGSRQPEKKQSCGCL
ncbi:hypothetical protein COV93_05600 [Candidatus Woesearchaeota archaeon CG11_big_fil_rev_8_21_14_0_20_43_8]|nr:MAG: hypothetical protein COV93_05600 [Candidatus Woesearchaeota archaeon CG11_big_fil_rev_8_21_14_0_20_43_8]PIO08870.1 MAG: hypothetical protein COT47_00825 [Candidatus Woesearchaeota archaeon CG08_land_8_20_14_0_20_43_7]